MFISLDCNDRTPSIRNRSWVAKQDIPCIRGGI
jgi:hypothetical protein